eukprot:TRINITY_DN36327_c0_g1_i3.p1 TRINITY_DN36327_c0_g1~~TRINITY_DN36327_c0_g1_i3.p1  ORF type:complete len:390 (+),score=97.99 TRINITY_DN36327_c0_g1_i3:185-1354(+)
MAIDGQRRCQQGHHARCYDAHGSSTWERPGAGAEGAASSTTSSTAEVEVDREDAAAAAQVSEPAASEPTSSVGAEPVAASAAAAHAEPEARAEERKAPREDMLLQERQSQQAHVRELRERRLQRAAERQSRLQQPEQKAAAAADVGAVATRAAASEAGRFLAEELPMCKEDMLQTLAGVPELLDAKGSDMRATLDFLEEELQPGRHVWAEVFCRDAKLLAAHPGDLQETLCWLEEFLWNQKWAVGYGRQSLSTAIQHNPELLYQGVDALDETLSWLERHGVSDGAVSTYVAGPTAVPFPLEAYPFLQLLAAGSHRLESGARWAESELGLSRADFAKQVKQDPYFPLLAATASGACERRPVKDFPLPTPTETFLKVQASRLQESWQLQDA